MTETKRGSWAVILVTAVVVAGSLAVYLMGLGWEDRFVFGFTVALPVGALLGFLTDLALKWTVDRYTARLRGP